MPAPTEKQLDQALNAALRERPEFSKWLLSKTKFADEAATYHWSRANYPWGKSALEVENPATGDIEVVEREGETDVLVVFQTSERRVALHIENKLSSGSFTHLQPELYASRAKSWKGNPKYESYDDWQTILIAPMAFYLRFPAESAKFERFVSHEEIANLVPEFKASN